MPPRSPIESLPEPIRNELDRRLVTGGFAGYDELAEWLKAQGVEISKSAVHRYGQRFEQKLSAIKNSSEMARQIAAVLPDEAGTVNEALMRMVQEGLFNLTVNMEEKEALEALPKIARAVSDMTRASISQKKYAHEVKCRTEKVAADVEKAVRKAGLTDETANDIRRRILGIAS